MKPECVANLLKGVPTWSKCVVGEVCAGSENHGMNSIDNSKVVAPDCNGWERIFLGSAPEMEECSNCQQTICLSPISVHEGAICGATAPKKSLTWPASGKYPLRCFDEAIANSDWGTDWSVEKQ
jgi:hypothetical protein